MDKLIGKTLTELKSITDSLGFPTFTAKQISEWLYKKKVKTIEEMTNLSKQSRQKLSEHYVVGRITYSKMVASEDGTKKYLFKTEGSKSSSSEGIEAVMIPDRERYTICVSSQIGCRMGCKFCMTGRQGFNGNLTPGEIISQFFEIDESDLLTNAVFMGMGEPLDNWQNVKNVIEILTSDWGLGWSPKRITLSTIGLNKDISGNVSPLQSFLETCSCHLAISIHNPFPDQRNILMPMESAFPIEKSIDLIKRYDFTGQRRVSFEYIMFSGINDSKQHADKLVRVLKGLECRVNLIRFHKIPESDLSSSPLQIMEIFRDRLVSAGIVATIRASRGEDILAACGMLSGKDNITH